MVEADKTCIKPRWGAEMLMIKYYTSQRKI